MCANTSNELFVDGLKHVYYTEQQLVAALADLENQSSMEDLQNAFSDHRSETQEHVDRLEEVFDRISESTSDDSGLVEQIEEFLDPSGDAAEGETDHVVDGLIADHEEFVSNDPDQHVLDLYNITAGQKSEHYEIAAYGNLIPLADQLGMDEVADILERNLREEQDALDALSVISEEYDYGQLPTA